MNANVLVLKPLFAAAGALAGALVAFASPDAAHRQIVQAGAPGAACAWARTSAALSDDRRLRLDPPAFARRTGISGRETAGVMRNASNATTSASTRDAMLDTTALGILPVSGFIPERAERVDACGSYRVPGPCRISVAFENL